MNQELYNELINFATPRQNLYAVYNGVDPEEGFQVYYFLVNSPWNEKQSDAISDLELKLADEKNILCFLLEWPVSPDQIDNYPFLGEPVWKRN